jgi:hypothetical protein
MMETFKAAYQHRGAALVEVYQNCNVFNDGAFEQVTSKDARPRMLIPLDHGRPIRFGAEKELGVVFRHGSAEIVRVDEVGEDALAVHDAHRPDPSLAFALSRLASGPTSPTPIGVFRAVERADYGSLVNEQLEAATAAKGPGDLATLLHSGSTWTVVCGAGGRPDPVRHTGVVKGPPLSGRPSRSGGRRRRLPVSVWLHSAPSWGQRAEIFLRSFLDEPEATTEGAAGATQPSSSRNTMPVRGLGQKNVVLGGMRTPPQLTAEICATVAGRRRTAAEAIWDATAAAALSHPCW